MSILKDSIAVELAQWNKTESPLVSFARSLRNEGASHSSSGTGNEGNPSGNTNGDGDGPADPFAGINLDELEPQVRDQVVAAQAQFALLQTEAQKAQTEMQNQANLARQHQSRADQMHHKLKAHNLLDGAAPASQEDQEETELKDAFMREHGMDAKTAGTWAKMMKTANTVSQRRTVESVTHTLSPLVQTVGSMHADRIFAQAQTANADPNGLLQIPEIYEQVHQGMQVMVQNGQPVSIAAVQSLAHMAYGEMALQNPGILQNSNNQQPVVYNNANVRGSSRGLPSPSGGAMRPRLNQQQQNGDGAPVARDQDTARAAAATVAHMLRGTNIKPKQ